MKLAGIVFLYVFVALIVSIAEERNVMYVVNDQATGATFISTLHILFNPDPSTIHLWFAALWKVATLDYNGTIWQGGWRWAYYLCWGCISLGLLGEYVIQIIQSGMEMFGSVLRGIVGLGR